MAGQRVLRKVPGYGKAPRMVIRALVALLLQALAMLMATTAFAAPTNIAAELVSERRAGPGETIDLAIVMRPAAGCRGC